LKKHPTELEREPIFDVDKHLGRDWVWHYVETIGALEAEKIVWPDLKPALETVETLDNS